MNRKKYYKLMNDFYYKYRDIREYSEDIPLMLNEWRNIMVPAICKYNFHVKKKQALHIADTLGYGNWTHLWENESEKKESIEDIAATMVGDLFFSSDRFTWDRLLRINWNYLRLMDRIDK